MQHKRTQLLSPYTQVETRYKALVTHDTVLNERYTSPRADVNAIFNVIKVITK